ncbi:4'-phosphopantetheinyl transferase superfamily protein [Streptomyces sp. NPDC088246]|uniref:4'-phosphopantetheinyl transferase superfamily protein n=1 Tax=Streptomyces sp. NPDC088246 TaxID=3365842 RepID=UPI0037F25277
MAWNRPEQATRLGSDLHPRKASELLALPAQSRPLAFARAWVRKEAYLKGLGTGLTRGLSVDEVGTGPVLTQSSPGWLIAYIAPGRSRVAAIAVRRRRLRTAAGRGTRPAAVRLSPRSSRWLRLLPADRVVGDTGRADQALTRILNLPLPVICGPPAVIRPPVPALPLVTTPRLRSHRVDPACITLASPDLIPVPAPVSTVCHGSSPSSLA